MLGGRDFSTRDYGTPNTPCKQGYFNGALFPFDIPLPVSYFRMGINWKTLNIHDDI